MMSYTEFAKSEFRVLGWLDDQGIYRDPQQESICSHVLALLKLLSEEGHSEASIHYTLDLLNRVALFKPLAPLTGADDEWCHVADESDGTSIFSE